MTFKHFLLSLVSGLLLISSHNVAAEKILRYTDHEPYGGMRTQIIKEIFFAEIEKESQCLKKAAAEGGFSGPQIAEKMQDKSALTLLCQCTAERDSGSFICQRKQTFFHSRCRHRLFY